MGTRNRYLFSLILSPSLSFASYTPHARRRWVNKNTSLVEIVCFLFFSLVATAHTPLAAATLNKNEIRNSERYSHMATFYPNSNLCCLYSRAKHRRREEMSKSKRKKVSIHLLIFCISISGRSFLAVFVLCISAHLRLKSPPSMHQQGRRKQKMKKMKRIIFLFSRNTFTLGSVRIKYTHSFSDE